jgi:hypothetical protein
MKVFIVAEQGLKCPTEDLKEFIANSNFKLRISDKRPEHHKTIIGQNILLDLDEKIVCIFKPGK